MKVDRLDSNRWQITRYGVEFIVTKSGKRYELTTADRRFATSTPIECRSLRACKVEVYELVGKVGTIDISSR
jgi:hypothetical protein